MKAGRLSGMVQTEPKADTEIFYVYVVSGDAQEAIDVANKIADVFPQILEEKEFSIPVTIMDNATKANQVSPNLSKNLILGVLIGIVLSAGVIVLSFLFDPYIRSEEEISKNYDIPLLAVIPIHHSRGKRGKHYRSYRAYANTQK